MEDVQECQLCGRFVTATLSIYKRQSHLLWNYLYHKDVRETLMPSPGTRDLEEKNTCPKLTFTLSLGTAPPPGNGREEEDTLLVCEDCYPELRQLSQLHTQLENAKKLIASQVERIENVGHLSITPGHQQGEGGNRKRRRLNSLWSKDSPSHGYPGVDVALAGTSVGRDNIFQVLRCLGNLCEGISEPRENVHPRHSSTFGDPPIHPTNATKKKAEEGPMNAVEVDATGRYDEGEGDSEFFSGTTPQNLGPPPFQHLEPEGDQGDPIINTVKQEPESCQGSLFSENDYSLEDYSATADPAKDPLAEEGEVTATTSLRSLLSIPPKIPGPSQDPFSASTKTPCKVCGKLVHRGYLKMHMRVHNGDTPFRCEFCGRCFPRSHHLENHRRTHTREKPFTCTLCHRGFTQRSSLASHIKNIHGGADG